MVDRVLIVPLLFLVTLQVFILQPTTVLKNGLPHSGNLTGTPILRNTSGQLLRKKQKRRLLECFGPMLKILTHGISIS